MSELDALQSWIAAELLSPRALYKDESKVARARLHLTGNDRVSPIEQLEIYREQFWLRHTGALLEDFPGLSGVLGQAAWEPLVESYLIRYPPRSESLRDLGDRFVEHVQSQTHLPHHLLCVDMARLEWAYVEIFDARDVPPLDPSRLSTIPETAWHDAVVLLNPALSLLRVDYPVAELRRTLRSEPQSAVPIPDAEPQNLVLYRASNRSLYHRVLDDLAFALLGELGRGTPLVPACEKLSTGAPDAASRLEREVGTWFSEWGRLGFITDVKG